MVASSVIYRGRLEISRPKRLFQLEFTTAAGHRKMPTAYQKMPTAYQRPPVGTKFGKHRSAMEDESWAGQDRG